MASAPNSGVPKVLQESEEPQSTADMTAFVQNLLLQMQSRFQAMSESIVSKNILSTLPSVFPSVLSFP
ncbi:uncharacterized protein A4U43_C05F22860 [Asparagus officinalis]|uniref:Heat shock factor binding protein n=1 Tax=Asparagus officinalis TaxID=4686 RepID=A0A5P1ETR5_ASPOF|nr:uncharacterized protein A4U43_C05F22860 [Asparagus officinalis]